MAEPDWIIDPLSFLIGAVSLQDFFAKYHERKALLCQHEDRERFSGLLTISRIDELIANSELPAASLDMARKHPSIDRSYFTFKNGNIDRGAVIHHFQQGATIILNQLQLADASLAGFCRALEDRFSAHVQTNVYLTPSDNQGFNTHYDDHDVFILQVSGQKKWRLYQKPVDNPYQGEKFRAKAHDPGELDREFVLQAGQCIYIPRGLMHDAESHGSEPSLHITVGLLVKKWADLMLEAISEVALKNDSYRRSLPPGFAREDFDRDSARDTFKELTEAFRQQADFDKVFELFRENFVRQRRPDVGSALLDASRTVDQQDFFVKRSNAQAILKQDDTEALVVCGGGDLHFDLEAATGLQKALSGEPFTISAFAELESSKAEAVLRKLYAFGLIRSLETTL